MVVIEGEYTYELPHQALLQACFSARTLEQYCFCPRKEAMPSKMALMNSEVLVSETELVFRRNVVRITEFEKPFG